MALSLPSRQPVYSYLIPQVCTPWLRTVAQLVSVRARTVPFTSLRSYLATK